jgi:hypothetical protein
MFGEEISSPWFVSLDLSNNNCKGLFSFWSGWSRFFYGRVGFPAHPIANEMKCQGVGGFACYTATDVL